MQTLIINQPRGYSKNSTDSCLGWYLCYYSGVRPVPLNNRCCTFWEPESYTKERKVSLFGLLRKVKSEEPAHVAKRDELEEYLLETQLTDPDT